MHPPFVEQAGAVAGLPVFRIPASLGPGEADPMPWLTTAEGTEWVTTIGLREGDWLQTTGGQLQARLVAVTPELDVERVFQLVDAITDLPPSEDAPLAADSPAEVPAILVPRKVDALLRRYMSWLTSDDVERSVIVGDASSDDLRSLVARGEPILATIDDLLTKVAVADTVSAADAEIEGHLHDFAQLAIEARFELQRRPRSTE